MNDKPKSFWKKSWKGSRLFLIWLALVITIMVSFSISILLIGKPFTEPSDFGVVLIDGVVGVSIVFGLWLFIRWLCCWRNFKRFLFGCACLATLIALFYAEEDWRGKHDWEKYKHQWEAKGEKFNFADFVPPPVPDDQNFAMAPIFDATRNLASRKWRNEHRNQHPVNGQSWDTNLVDPLQMETSVYIYNHGDQPTNGYGYWAKGTITDLSSWQNYYRQLASKSNEFPTLPQPQTPAQDVLLALSKYDPAIEELRQASQRPDSRFPLDYDDENPAEILLPHLAALKRCSQVLQLRAIAELQNGESEKALADIKLNFRLIDSVHSEPFIITHLVRRAILQITLQPVWEGLAEHKWSDAQLAELDSELSKLDFLADYEFSVRSERAAHIKIVDWMEQKRSRFWELFNMIDNDYKGTMKHFGLSVEIYLMPKGWYYQSEIVLSKAQQQWVLPMVDDAQQTVSPQAARESVATVGSLRPTGVNLFARLLLPELGNYAEKVANGQTVANEARIAIALERYRLAHGRYPDSLDALVPQFMEKIPHDIIGGQPLHYRLTEDGLFVLYSVGWNERDDGGTVGFKTDGTVDMNTGDWVWRYPAR